MKRHLIATLILAVGLAVAPAFPTLARTRSNDRDSRRRQSAQEEQGVSQPRRASAETPQDDGQSNTQPQQQAEQPKSTAQTPIISVTPQTSPPAQQNAAPSQNNSQPTPSVSAPQPAPTTPSNTSNNPPTTSVVAQSIDTPIVESPTVVQHAPPAASTAALVPAAAQAGKPRITRVTYKHSALTPDQSRTVYMTAAGLVLTGTLFLYLGRIPTPRKPLGFPVTHIPVREYN